MSIGHNSMISITDYEIENSGNSYYNEYSIGIGNNTLRYAKATTNNTVIGESALQYQKISSDNTIIGYYAAAFMSGSTCKDNIISFF